MSVAGYVGRNVRELRMPKGVSDDLGIGYTGAVLTGETTPEAKRLAEDFLACRRGAERYFDAGDYDPVLKSHCGW
jgi:hypothetical protein